MIKTLLIDDEDFANKGLKILLNNLCPEIEICGMANSAEEAVDLVKKHHPSLVFLDIEMPGGNGFDFLDLVPERNFQIIFVTAYHNYAIEAFNYSALDYILKPIDPERLVATVKRVRSISFNQHDSAINVLKHNLNTEKKKIVLSSQTSSKIIDIDDIIRVESSGSYTTFSIVNEDSIMVSKGLAHFERILDPNIFFRSHQSHLINKNHFKEFLKTDGGQIVMKDDSSVPIAIRRKEAFKRTFGL